MICPKCKADIPGDCWFCDQCGAELMFCPQCKTPAKGKRCTQCGSVLVSAAQLDRPAPSQPAPNATTVHPSQPDSRPAATAAPQSREQADQRMTIEDIFTQFGDIFGGKPAEAATSPAAANSASSTQRPQPAASSTQRPGSNAPRVPDTEPTRLVMIDNPARVVTLKPNGLIGRTTGDYLDVFADQPYVSGTHAQITLHSSMKWLITDKGSTNGTRIGNTQLEPHKHYLLKKGQTVEIGFVKFRVE